MAHTAFRKARIALADLRVHAFVSEFQNLIRTVANETELRTHFVTAANGQLQICDLKLERGRQDVRRNRVIIEFKDKGLFRGTKMSAKFQEALGQLVKTYIPNQAKEDKRNPVDYLGVCFDGVHLAFVYFEANGGFRVTELRRFDERSAAVLVLALDRDKRIELTIANVADDFGPDSSLAHTMLRALWDHLEHSLRSRTNRVEMLFGEWKDLFEQSTSLGEIGKAQLGQYLSAIGIPANADLTHVLFVLHTYHALFFKLLAAEVVLTNRLLPGVAGDYCFGAAALPDSRLVESLEQEIEDSRLFQQVNMLNFVEGSFFSWYLVRPPKAVIDAIRHIMQRLTLYRLSGLQLSHTRDIVKHIYQQLVPAVLRHNIGEYFTPEWLVEFTLDRVGYDGPDILDRKYLDPCCGSGNFLIHAIDRYKTQARAAGWDDATILKYVTSHIFGFDLNPLAVLTARANYLIAISDLIGTSSEVEIPVYQADAIYAPTSSVHGSLAGATRVREIHTRKRTLSVELPERLIMHHRLFGRLMLLMEQCIQQGESVDVFFGLLTGEPAYLAEPDRETWKPFLRDMFSKIAQLEQENWNRIWSRLIRNYFASVAVGACQYVAGNPPWVRWSELPATYAARIKDICVGYHIFSEDKFFGGNELDISAMITYTVADKWLDTDGGRLSFVITQTHFQSQSSGGFRQFSVNGVPMRVWLVDDLVAVRPFQGLSNKTAVINIEKGQPTTYPVEYRRWRRKASRTIPDEATWSTAQPQLASERLEAQALKGPGKRWIILPPGRFHDLQVLDGKDEKIEGRKGITTDLNGAYFVRLLGQGRLPDTIRVKSQPELGRSPIPSTTGDVEVDLVYPLIKGGGDIRPFYATSSSQFVIVPNVGITPRVIPTATHFLEVYPGAWQYFHALNRRSAGQRVGRLDARSTWKTRMLPQFEQRVRERKMKAEDIPFYAVYDVGSYTFAPYKVVWAEMAGTLQAAVIADAEVPFGGGMKPIIPDHKVYFAAFGDVDVAHYVCALLNSEPVRTFVDGFTIKIQVGTLFRHIILPVYDAQNRRHRLLACYSAKAHRIMAETGGEDSVSRQQSAIDRLATQVLASALAETQSGPQQMAIPE